MTRWLDVGKTQEGKINLVNNSIALPQLPGGALF
jgi:hypothetical protein